MTDFFFINYYDLTIMKEYIINFYIKRRFSLSLSLSIISKNIKKEKN